MRRSAVLALAAALAAGGSAVYISLIRERRRRLQPRVECVHGVRQRQQRLVPEPELHREVVDARRVADRQRSMGRLGRQGRVRRQHRLRRRPRRRPRPPTTTPPTSPPTTTAHDQPPVRRPLPKHFLTGYWQNFDNPANELRLRDVPANYDLIAVAFADADQHAGRGHLHHRRRAERERRRLHQRRLQGRRRDPALPRQEGHPLGRRREGHGQRRRLGAPRPTSPTRSTR